jgi:shikimate kinase
MHVVLLGLMGAGKTSIGRRVAERLGRELIDGDDELEARTGRDARSIAEAAGIEELHRLEADVALDALTRTEPGVIAPAASVIEVPEVRDALRGHTVVWLTASAEHLALDVADGSHRPLVRDVDPLELIEEQLIRRQPLAIDLATLVVDVSSGSKDELAQHIVDAVTT